MVHERPHGSEIARAYCRSVGCERDARSLAGARATIDRTLGER